MARPRPLVTRYGPVTAHQPVPPAAPPTTGPGPVPPAAAPTGGPQPVPPAAPTGDPQPVPLAAPPTGGPRPGALPAQPPMIGVPAVGSGGPAAWSSVAAAPVVGRGGAAAWLSVAAAPAVGSGGAAAWSSVAPAPAVGPGDAVAWSSRAAGSAAGAGGAVAGSSAESVEPAATIFSPEGLVAWALATDDGPPTTVLHLGPPTAWSPGADAAALTTAEPAADRPQRGWRPRFPVPRRPRPGAGGGVRRTWLDIARRLAGLRGPASRIVIPAPRRFRLRRRPPVPLLIALAVGITLALLVAVPTRTPTGAPPAQTALVAPGQVTGLALGEDRLPDCAPVVATLSPRQKLAQRLMVGVAGTDPDATARLVHEMQIGGIFVNGSAIELLSDEALRGVQAASRLPLAVAVDDEGGRVQRIDAIDGDLPSARTLAATLRPADVQRIARNRGSVLAASGITMNFAPDVDVSDQRAGAAIGDRSFSSDPDTVTAYAAAFAQGEHEAGIFTMLKHFPGHGHADGDSHRSRVTTPPLDQLRASDLTPYAGLLRPGGPLADPASTGVLVGHLDVPGLTADLPSSLTPATYRLLRDTYHFDGLTITDDLGAMKAVSAELALPEAVARALAAGADMALWTSGDPVTPVLDGLDRALASGALDPKANDTAVERVLAAKGVCTRR
jgi:beta-N-acetylhexosaminidase